MNELSYPLISVVMSVYNGEKYLSEAIDSILLQSYSNLELIIVSDGSTDNSVDIIRKYMVTDNRIVLIDRENKGLPFSLNEGIARAKGKYIARMDADDISLPNRLEKQIRYLHENKLDVCGSYCEAFGENIRHRIIAPPISHTDIKFRLMFSSAFAHPTVMFRKEVFDKVAYNCSYKVAQDYKLWVDIVSKGFKLGNIPEVLMRYRTHSGQASTKKSEMQKKAAKQIRRDSIKMLNPEEASIVSRSLELDQNISLIHFASLLKDTNQLAKKRSISVDTAALALKYLYESSIPKSIPKSLLFYLIYIERSKEYYKKPSEELRVLAKALINPDSKTFRNLKVIVNKLNL